MIIREIHKMTFASANGLFGVYCSIPRKNSREHIIQHKKQSLVRMKRELRNMLCKKKFCMHRKYETMSPACVVYWNDVEELSSEVEHLKVQLEELDDDKYLGFDSIESRFYDV